MEATSILLKNNEIITNPYKAELQKRKWAYTNVWKIAQTPSN